MTEKKNSKTALPGAKRKNAFTMPPENIVIIGIDTDDKSVADHYLYDPRIELPLREEEILNVLEYGVLEPVICVKEGDKAVAVDGRQRIRLAREANKRLKKQKEPLILVDVVLKRGKDTHLLGVSVAANEVRKDDGILMKAEKARVLMDRGYSEGDVAVTFGVSKTAVKQWLSVLECTPDVRKLVEAGKLSASAAVKLSKLDKDEQKEQAQEMVATGKTTAADAQARAKTKKAKKNGEPVDDGYVLKAPSKRIVRKLVLGVQRDGEETPLLDGDDQRVKDFLAGVRWVMGDLNPASIKGLVGILNDL
jgi:ParB family chromosome partitioning protein